MKKVLCLGLIVLMTSGCSTFQNMKHARKNRANNDTSQARLINDPNANYSTPATQHQYQQPLATNQQAGNYDSQMNQLETQLQARNNEITELKYEIQRMSDKMDQQYRSLKSSQTNQPMIARVELAEPIVAQPVSQQPTYSGTSMRERDYRNYSISESAVTEVKQNLDSNIEDISNVALEDDIIRIPVPAERVQLALKNAGYYSGAIDGKVGPMSKKAIFEFQKYHNLKVDGIVGKQTWGVLKSYVE